MNEDQDETLTLKNETAATFKGQMVKFPEIRE